MKITVLITGLVLAITAMFIGNNKTATLTGQLQDETGTGILFGSLEIYTKDVQHKLIYSAETDLNGKFSLNDLTPGLYEIIIKAPGFEDKTNTIDLRGKANNLGAIRLQGNVITLDTAVIYGKSDAI